MYFLEPALSKQTSSVCYASFTVTVYMNIITIACVMCELLCRIRVDQYKNADVLGWHTIG